MIDQYTLLLIFVAIVLLFGANKLPELAKSLGKAAGEFKKAQIDAEKEINRLKNVDECKQNIQEKKSCSESILSLAKDLSIETNGKDENAILDEIQKKIRLRNTLTLK